MAKPSLLGPLDGTGFDFDSGIPAARTDSNNHHLKMSPNLKAADDAVPRRGLRPP